MSVDIQKSFYFSDMCVRFAELERKLGEIDRARALYMHASQIADPRVSTANKINQLRNDYFIGLVN